MGLGQTSERDKEVRTETKGDRERGRGCLETHTIWKGKNGPIACLLARPGAGYLYDSGLRE